MLYIATVYILVFKRRRLVSLNKPILIVASAMYSVAILVRHKVNTIGCP